MVEGRRAWAPFSPINRGSISGVREGPASPLRPGRGPQPHSRSESQTFPQIKLQRKSADENKRPGGAALKSQEWGGLAPGAVEVLVLGP